MIEEELKTLEEENQKLKEENEQLRLEKERIKNLPPKERMYEKIHVSLRTMNIIIGVLFAILIIVLVMGLLDR